MPVQKSLENDWMLNVYIYIYIYIIVGPKKEYGYIFK